MDKMVVSIPDRLAARMCATIPARQRSAVIRHLLEIEIIRREQNVVEAVKLVEQDEQLRTEMSAWDITVADGLRLSRLLVQQQG